MKNNDINLTEQFGRAARLLMRQRLRDAKEDSGKPDAWRKRLLGLIKARPGIMDKALVKLLNRRMDAGEELLLGLEKKGYVVLKPAEGSDGKAVELTEKGEKEAADYMDPGAAFNVLSDEEQAAMSGYLSRVIEALEKETGVKGDEMDEGFMGLRGMLGAFGPGGMRKLHRHFAGSCPDGFDPRGGYGPWGREF